MFDPIPDPIPSCAVTLYYGGPKPFTYYCTHAATGWHVQPDGGIHPPSNLRIVQITLSQLPTSKVALAGFRISETHPFPPGDWTPPRDFPEGVTVKIPGGVYPPPPPSSSTPGPLLLDFTRCSRKLFYQLAVNVDGGDPIWDDPKIYDDGSQ